MFQSDGVAQLVFRSKSSLFLLGGQIVQNKAIICIVQKHDPTQSTIYSKCQYDAVFIEEYEGLLRYK